MDLAALLARYARSGDAAAMEELVRRTRGRLLRAARRICGEHDAEDAVQGAYHALLRRGPLPGDVPPLGWLVTTCVRMAWRRRALARRHAALAERLAAPDDGPSRGAERAERARLLREAVARLPRRYRDPIVLHHLVGMRVAEVSRLMELPESTVKTRLRRGRALLEGRLAPLFAGALLFVPWMLADLSRPLATGGIMKLKYSAGIALLALGTGAIGFAAGTRRKHAPVRRFEAPRHEEAHARAPVREPDPEPAGTPPAEAPPPADRWEAELAKAAAARGVPAETVARVKMALVTGNALRLTMANGNSWVDHHLAEFQESMEPLLAAGAEGFAAALAVLDTGAAAPILPEMLARTCPPGGEVELMRLAADPSLPEHTRAQAIEALGAVDAPGVLAFLARRVGEETAPSTLLAALDALTRRGGRPERLDGVEAVLRGPGWRGCHRRILELLAGSGDPRTADALVRWARDPEFPAPGPALDALARLDEERARLEAAALLDGSRAEGLHPMQRARLRVVAGRW